MQKSQSSMKKTKNDCTLHRSQFLMLQPKSMLFDMGAVGLQLGWGGGGVQ